MTYAEALAMLLRSTETHGIAFALGRPRSDQRELMTELFGEALAREISEVGYPGDLEVPVSAEDLYLYPLFELEQRQVGYRIDARTGQPARGWDEDRFVLGDWTGNPVTIGRDGAIAFSLHGRGSQEFHPIAPDFVAFLDVLAQWVVLYGERAGKIVDADFVILPEVAETVHRRVTSSLAVTEAKNFCDLLLGTI